MEQARTLLPPPACLCQQHFLPRNVQTLCCDGHVLPQRFAARARDGYCNEEDSVSHILVPSNARYSRANHITTQDVSFRSPNGAGPINCYGAYTCHSQEQGLGKYRLLAWPDDRLPITLCRILRVLSPSLRRRKYLAHFRYIFSSMTATCIPPNTLV